MIRINGVLTRALTPDQRGWAKLRYPAHYRTNGARWSINPDKPAIPVPVNEEHRPTRKVRRHAS